MRSPGGLDIIKKAVEQLAKHHERHIRLYDPIQVCWHVLPILDYSKTASSWQGLFQDFAQGGKC